MRERRRCLWGVIFFSKATNTTPRPDLSLVDDHLLSWKRHTYRFGFLLWATLPTWEHGLQWLSRCVSGLSCNWRGDRSVPLCFWGWHCDFLQFLFDIFMFEASWDLILLNQSIGSVTIKSRAGNVVTVEFKNKVSQPGTKACIIFGH